MKKRAGKLKTLLLFFLFTGLFFWWLIRIYLPESRQELLITEPFPDNAKQLFGKPKAKGLINLDYIGFTVGYDTIRKNPVWVAYNLKSNWLKADKILAERDFKPDPELPSRWMSALADFKKSGYDRGHLARQADMRGRSLLCEQEACYLVNISPQKAKFNQKTWLNLENAVQKWANINKEVWIVAGPWFDNQKELLNQNTEIPDGFYKIIVKNNQGRFAFQCFVFRQSDLSLDLNSYITPIDSVESLTGIDFFTELPDSLEDKIESSKFKLWKGWR